MDELFQKISEIKAEDFAKQLNESNPDHYKAIFNDGHKKATAILQPKLDSVEKDLAASEAKGTELNKKLEEAGKANPDVQKMQARFEATIEGLQEQVAGKDTEIERIKTESTDKVRRKSLDVFRSKTVSEAFEMGTPLEIAKILAKDPDLESRLIFDDDMEIVGAYQDESRTAQIPLTGDMTVHQAIAKELYTKSPAKEDRRQRGSNNGQPPQPGGRVTISVSDAADATKYRAAQERASKAGVEVQVVA